MRFRSNLLTVLVASSFVASHAVAQQVFTSRATFNAATGRLSGFEGFESDFVGQFNPSFTAFTVTFPGFTVTETGTEGNLVISQARSVFAPSPAPVVTEGTGALIYTPNEASGGMSTLTFNFLTPINAFGFDLTSRFGVTTLAIGGGVTGGTVSVSSAPTFFGYVDTRRSFTQVTLNVVRNAPDYIGVDALAFGTVPEPDALLLLVSGVLPLLLVTAKRRRS